MAHFAELDNQNIVTRVLVVDNSVLIDETGSENESLGVNHLKQLFGQDSVWKQTSYNNRFRCKYAGIGDIYNSQTDCFENPQQP